MWNCRKFTSTVIILCSYKFEGKFEKSIYSFAMDNSNCSAYSTGIKIEVIDGSNFGSDFPNSSIYPYRKLSITVH